jgi:hypothetical protein
MVTVKTWKLRALGTIYITAAARQLIVLDRQSTVARDFPMTPPRPSWAVFSTAKQLRWCVRRLSKSSLFYMAFEDDASIMIPSFSLNFGRWRLIVSYPDKGVYPLFSWEFSKNDAAQIIPGVHALQCMRCALSCAAMSLLKFSNDILSIQIGAPHLRPWLYSDGKLAFVITSHTSCEIFRRTGAPNQGLQIVDYRCV